MLSTPIAQTIYSVLTKAQTALVVTHRRPDPDALGSLTAMLDWLESRGTVVTPFCREVVPGMSAPAFLIDPTRLISDPALVSNKHFDVVVVLDASDAGFAGVADILPSLAAPVVVVNIDHHATNTHFGTYNLVDSESASATELLYRFFTTYQIPISSRMASAMLAGILSDTTQFTNANTTATTLAVVGHLVAAGAPLALVSDALSKTKSIVGMNAWGAILSDLRYNAEYGVVIAIVPETSSDGGDTVEGVANFLNKLYGMAAVLVLRQADPDHIKGSLRTSSDLIDVSKLAMLWGGGGHKKAAGFRLAGRLEKMADGSYNLI